MKRILLPILLLTSLACGGCTQHYVMKMTNGMQITTSSKPKLKGSNYYWKDGSGKVNQVPQSRVVQIMPASEAKDEGQRFKPELK